MTTWDDTVDFVTVGSGGGGMAAALTAADSGASVLVLEKQDRIGGSTCDVRRDRLGSQQSRDAGPGGARLLRGRDGSLRGRRRQCRTRRRRSSAGTRSCRRDPRWSRFSRSVACASSTAVATATITRSAKGGHDLGRGIEPVPYDGRVLGEWLDTLQSGLRTEPRPGRHDERGSFALPLQQKPRCVFGLSTSGIPDSCGTTSCQALLTNGASLIAQMLSVAIAGGVSIWTEAPLEDLIVEDGRVAGVRDPARRHSGADTRPSGSPARLRRLRPQP